MNSAVATNLSEGKISFCTTCRNRLWQLEQTLPANLETVGDVHELSLVDYGSTDGMADWVWSNFRSHIEAGRLRFFEVRNPVHWSSPRSKNLAHRLGRGDYLFNLDADNWITPADVKLVMKARGMGLPCQQSQSFGNGSFGRIGLPRSLFDEMGGYDENLLPMGAQDMNLLERFKAMGVKLAKMGVPQKEAVQNTFEQKMVETGSQGANTADEAVAAFSEMAKINHVLARARLAHEGPRLLGGFASYRGLLNGEPVTIDGFNVIRPDETVQASAAARKAVAASSAELQQS